jgi:uncharacterized membrane protein YhdT
MYYFTQKLPHGNLLQHMYATSLHMVDAVFMTMRYMLGDSWLVAVALESGGDNTRGVKGLNFWVEIPRSCLAMAQDIVLRAQTFSSVKT